MNANATLPILRRRYQSFFLSLTLHTCSSFPDASLFICEPSRLMGRWGDNGTTTGSRPPSFTPRFFLGPGFQ
ncbi:hypothetical protein B0H63DRAFT_275437 [Podospora didyma]|uniref:Uncharacterized protein n=1 Tax=Podospora didyma TaxID=330526 RepID=A0AAE0KF12_9PEZI|nr:hypothetical protein B0H63DRAFT_275437 [Podospora didyma]